MEITKNAVASSGCAFFSSYDVYERIATNLHLVVMQNLSALIPLYGHPFAVKMFDFQQLLSLVTLDTSCALVLSLSLMLGQLL